MRDKSKRFQDEAFRHRHHVAKLDSKKARRQNWRVQRMEDDDSFSI